jgi:tetratricopeptide (TPR) repeat protein
LSGADLDQTIGALRVRLGEQEDARAYTALGVAYLQKVRETGDPTFYTQAEGVLNRALELEPESFETLSSLGALALARHEFELALDFGERARGINPHNAHNYGVIGDALLELGRYDEAFATFQTMVDLRPDLSSYARISYARELSGDIDGAIQAMQQAREAGGPRPENVAYTSVLLGNLYFNSGDLSFARLEYEAAERTLPDYPGALAGLARIAAAEGDLDQAAELLERAAEIYPTVEYVGLLGDVYFASGRREEAQRQYDLVEAIASLAEQNGVNTGLELALFNADHSLQLEGTLPLARAEYVRRPGVHTADVLAWTLYQSGEYAGAAAVIQDALQLGTKDPLILFHAGMIAYRNGDFGTSADLLQEALDTNPHFSLLYSDDARETLAAVRVLAGDEVNG